MVSKIDREKQSFRVLKMMKTTINKSDEEFSSNKNKNLLTPKKWKHKDSWVYMTVSL